MPASFLHWLYIQARINWISTPSTGALDKLVVSRDALDVRSGRTANFTAPAVESDTS